jgi:four helix bundle protein
MSEELENGKPDIVSRTVAYSLDIIRFYRELEKDGVGRVIGKQVLRSGTSIGANVHEAQSGQSKADFIAKMYVAYKEARETSYWLRIIQDAGLADKNRLAKISDETSQLVKILSSILLTSKQGNKTIHHS